MKTLFFTILLISFSFLVKATELPLLNLEIGEIYRIETTTYVDTSAQWLRRYWDYRKWDFTPMSYNDDSKTYKIEAKLVYYQHVIQQKFDYRGWMENEVYETGYLEKYRSPIVYMNANLIPIYFNLSTDGEVSNIDFSEFKKYKTPEGYRLEVYENSQSMIQRSLNLIFLQFRSSDSSDDFSEKNKGGYEIVEGDKSTVSLNCTIPEEYFFYQKVINSDVIVDKRTGLILRNHINYLIPQMEYSNALTNKEKGNYSVYYQKYISEYNSNFKVVNYSPYSSSFDTVITSSNFILNGKLDNKIEGQDSIVVRLGEQGISLKMPLDEDGEFKLELNLNENIQLQIIYPPLEYKIGQIDHEYFKRLLQTSCSLSVEPGDSLALLLNSDFVLRIDSIDGLGSNIFSNDSRFNFSYSDYSNSNISNHRLEKEERQIVAEKNQLFRSTVSPQKYINYINRFTYRRDRLPAKFGDGFSNKLLVNNVLAKTSTDYLRFIDDFIDNTLDAKISMSTGVDGTDYNSERENNYYLGQIALSEPVKSHFLAYYLKRIIHDRNWSLNDRLYQSFKQNYSDKPVFDDVELIYNKYKVVSPGHPSPEFKLTTLRETTISKKDLEKHVTVLFFYNQISYSIFENQKDDLQRIIGIYTEINKEFTDQLEFILAYSGSIEEAKIIQGQLPVEIKVCLDKAYPLPGVFREYMLNSSSISYIVLDRNGYISYNSPQWFYGNLPSSEVEKALAIPYESKNEIPFWLRITFISLIGVIIAIILTFIFYRNIAKRRIQKSELNNKMRELELTAIRAQMNPHFMYNCLNSIQNLVQKNQNDEAHLYLSKFASLIRRVLNTSKKEEVSLSEELATIREYIDLEKLRFDFEYQLIIDKNIDVVSVFVPPMLLQPFVENALLHGLLPKTENRVLCIRIYRKENGVCIDVDDNGVGRHASSLQESSGNGKGLQLSEERLKLIAEKYQTEFSLEIKDLISTDGLSLGTRVSLCFEEEV